MRALFRYITNTHAATHSTYTLDIDEVYTIKRAGEKASYTAKSAGLHNKRLLWHGSRLSNWIGILKEGLRIAPPSAPTTGYMFGKGVYFADMVSKSANYCFASATAPDGVLLLSEVALGSMYECKKAEYVEGLPVGKHSTFGVGKTMPDKNDVLVTDDGVTVPFGKGIKSGVKGSDLLYNE
jgi:poly [ADP-ribose] polymerase